MKKLTHHSKLIDDRYPPVTLHKPTQPPPYDQLIDQELALINTVSPDKGKFTPKFKGESMFNF
jgi:hypothetical protein